MMAGVVDQHKHTVTSRGRRPYLYRMIIGKKLRRDAVHRETLG